MSRSPIQIWYTEYEAFSHLVKIIILNGQFTQITKKNTHLCPLSILHTGSKQLFSMKCVHAGKVTKYLRILFSHNAM